MTPTECLELLHAGNARWSAGVPERPHRSPEYRASLVGGQQPYGHVICCIDSRVVPELLFDCGLGDLLVTRVPGNPVFDAVVASARFSVRHLHVGVVYVLGHQSCGAVNAALQAADDPDEAPEDVRAVAALLAPAMRSAAADLGPRDPDDLADPGLDVVIRNVELGLRTLRDDELLSAFIADRSLIIKGGWYELATGVVHPIF